VAPRTVYRHPDDRLGLLVRAAETVALRRTGPLRTTSATIKVYYTCVCCFYSVMQCNVVYIVVAYSAAASK